VQTKAKDHDGKEIGFEGVSVADVLKLAGVQLGGDTMRGKRLAEYLLVEAKDNYKAVFSLTEFEPDFTDTVIVLADKADGKPLDEKSGPWQIIVPNQKKHARWVREVSKLTVKPLSSRSP
jgi:Oxidoreductase molybdopterin binding domain